MKTLFWMESITQKDLRDACAELHKEAEKTQLAQELIAGTIDPAIYTNYCYQLYLIADLIESQIVMTDDLYRRHLLVKDIALGPSADVKACPSTEKYLSHLSRCYNPQVNGQYKGHIYTHYLGWLYGGQMISKRLNLPKHHLHFNNVRECVDHVRDRLLGLVFDRDAEEAKLAFSYTIKIYNELYEP